MDEQIQKSGEYDKAMAAALREEEQRNLFAKAAGRAVLLAVAHADPGTLPPAVREARERMLELKP